MVDMNWFFLLVIALACAPVLGCLWWVVNSRISDRRRTRIAERMSQTYYHEAVKVPGREPERRSRRASDARDAETSGERPAIRDTGERAAVYGGPGERRAGWPQDDAFGAGGAWPADEPDPAEPMCCTPREVAQHDGPCDCWEDTEIFEVRDGLPAVPMVPRAPRRAAGWSAPGQPPAAGPQPGPPPAAGPGPQQPGPPPPAASRQPGAMPPAASGQPPQPGAPAGPPPRRSTEWRAPERPQQHPTPRNPVERRSVDAQRPPAARPPADRPVPPRPADRPQRPPAQRRERYQADRREGRPAQRGERRPVERTSARQPAQPHADTWPPASAVGEPARSGKHHAD